MPPPALEPGIPGRPRGSVYGLFTRRNHHDGVMSKQRSASQSVKDVLTSSVIPFSALRFHSQILYRDSCGVLLSLSCKRKMWNASDLPFCFQQKFNCDAGRPCNCQIPLPINYVPWVVLADSDWHTVGSIPTVCDVGSIIQHEHICLGFLLVSAS